MSAVGAGQEPQVQHPHGSGPVTPGTHDAERVDADVLVLGSANMDVLMAVSALPKGGETVLGGDIVFRPGGKGANQAVAAALADARVAMAGCVGDDDYGTATRAALAEAGVDVTLLRATAHRRTGLAVVLVAPDGENAIAVASGANHALVPRDADLWASAVRRAGVLLMQMELPVDVVVRAVDIAADAGTPVVLNLAPAVHVPQATLARLTVLVVNRAEASYLLGHDLPDLAALCRAADRLRGLGPRAVVVTAGGAGAVLADAGGAVHLPAATVDVVDTSGAGDAFVGVLAAALSGGRTLREAVVAATEAGAVAVQSRGARLTSLVAPTTAARTAGG
ncbi:MAG: ribokinase [Actinomycetota bacterium]|nr:ribokinase [Actinomycetota bacterium]